MEKPPISPAMARIIARLADIDARIHALQIEAAELRAALVAESNGIGRHGPPPPDRLH